ncbi:porin family protein [Tenacibaculum sp. IMCC1]
MRFNKLLFSFFIGVFTLSSYSQRQVKLGLSGGGNYSSLRFQDSSITEHDSEVGYLFGIATNIQLKNELSLQIELNYERKVVSVFSPEFEINGVKINSFRNYDLYDFMTLPVLLRYEVGEKSPFYINGGVFLGYLLSARERVNDGDLSEDLSEYFTDFDLGLSIGVGKIFLLDNSNELFVELRNNLGLTNIDSDPNGQYQKTNSLSFILGWNLVL